MAMAMAMHYHGMAIKLLFNTMNLLCIQGLRAADLLLVRPTSIE